MFENVTVIGKPKTATGQQVAQLEQNLASGLPSGYQQFVTVLGRGVLADFVTILSPEEILEGEDSTPVFRQELEAEGWRWDPDHPLAEAMSDLVLLGYTRSGDLLVFHPDEVDEIYSLSEETGQIELLSDSGLPEALENLLAEGETTGAAGQSTGQNAGQAVADLGEWEFIPREINKSISNGQTVVS